MASGSEPCRVCGIPARRVFELALLGRPTAYFECASCGYFQTEAPYWLGEAYQCAINDMDTGIMARNRLNVGRVMMTMLAYHNLAAKIVDHAGGYGILVRMLRDAGIDAEWRDKYCENLLARGFEAGQGPFALVTAFEVLEHLVEPFKTLCDLLCDAPIVLVSTDLIPTDQTPTPDWPYLGPEHGQHIGFFRLRTLRWMAGQAGCHFASDGYSLHVFSKQRIPRAWRSLQRLSAFWPMLARMRRRSKMLSDFDAMRSRRRS